MGLLESRCLEEAGPEALEEGVLSPGAGTSGAWRRRPQHPLFSDFRLRFLRRGCCPVVLNFLRGCDEAGAASVGRIQELEPPVG